MVGSEDVKLAKFHWTTKYACSDFARVWDTFCHTEWNATDYYTMFLFMVSDNGNKEGRTE